MQNEIKYKRRNWFDNKKCQICGKPGTIFRLIKYKHLILCDSQKCDYITRIRAGFFNEQLILKSKRR